MKKSKEPKLSKKQLNKLVNRLVKAFITDAIIEVDYEEFSDAMETCLPQKFFNEDNDFSDGEPDSMFDAKKMIRKETKAKLSKILKGIK